MPNNVYFFSAFIILSYMLFWFVLAQIKRDNGIVDVAWGMGFILVCSFIELRFRESPNFILWGIVTIWGLRLAVHIAIRNHKRGEDWRYAAWREEWKGRVVLQSLLRVFLLQGFFMWIIALPLMQIDTPGSVLQPYQYVGLGIWLIGFLWESIGDYQLLQFKRQATNRGKIMRSGLWSFSRHPNYFGEMILWWGIFIYTIPLGTWWIAIISPITISWLLMRISGVPMLERKYQDNPEYQDYVKKTNALFPKLF